MILRKKSRGVGEEKVKKESRLRIDRDEKIQDGELVETEWDLKKLTIGFVVLLLLIIIGSYIFFPSREAEPQALGATTQNLSPTPPLPDQEDVENVIKNAQETLSQITAENLTSSEAALQRVITDLETLKGKNGAVEILCHMVCKK